MVAWSMRQTQGGWEVQRLTQRKSPRDGNKVTVAVSGETETQRKRQKYKDHRETET